MFVQLSIAAIAAGFFVNDTKAQILNLDFGAATATSKVGLAATGQTAGDVWNYYSRDNGQGGWLTAGAVTNLAYVDGAASSVGVVVLNAPGAWGISSSDPMFTDYIYPFSGVATINFTNLPVGSYDLYAYGPDGIYQVTVGGVDYGSKATTNAPVVNPVAWQEGVQYVVLRNVVVGNGDVATLTVKPGSAGYATISGIQITPASGSSSNLPPLITSQPAGKSVGVGSNVTFTVLASGTAPFAYQWLYGGTALASATNYTLTLTNVQTNHAGNYSVIVANSYGSVTSVVAGLVVNQLTPTITTQPQSQTVAAGSNVLFTVAASGAPTLRYQWRRGGTNIIGATTPTLSLNNVQPTNAAGYSVRVYNNYGAVTSSVATLTVIGAAPSIVNQPTSQTVVVGTNVTFAVTASGSGPLKYQWRFNGVAISNAIQSSLTLANVQTNKTGLYSVVVTNSFGTATSSNALLTVLQVNRAPAANGQSVALAYNASTSITLTASDADNDPLTYTIASLPTNGTLSGTPPNLTYQAASNYSGSDSFTFYANDGQTNSGLATVAINVFPEGSKPLISVDFGAGASAKTGLAATGYSTNDFWNFYDRNGSNGSWLIFGAVSNLRTIDGAATVAGMTVANAPGAWGNGSVDPMYSSYIYPFNGGNVTVTLTNLDAGAYDIYLYGIDASYEVIANGLSYGSKALPNGPVANPVVWQENLQYVLFHAVQLANGIPLTITVRPGSGGYATISGLQIAQVDAPPAVGTTIIGQPASQTVAEGGSVTFNVAVSGTSPFRYQWRFNGADIGGATNSSLVLNPVAIGDSGDYSVRISNIVDAVTSSNASLVVTAINHPPVANSQSAVVAQNGSIALTLTGSDADSNALTYVVTSLPTHGSLTGTVPNLTYQPTSGYSGSDGFTFKVNDGQLDSATATVSIAVLADLSKGLINVDFGAGTSPSPKVGPAATGQAGNDVWNFYSRDDGFGNWLSFGSLGNLKLADGAISSAGLTVANAPGAWGNGSADPMYDTYIYPFNGGNVTVTVTNLTAGQYDVYVYGIDSSYQATVGAVNYGIKSLPNTPAVNPVVWTEGSQYVVFRNVSVASAAQPLLLTVTPGSGGYATISGLQIASVTALNRAPVAHPQVVSVSQDSTNSVILTANDLDGDALTYNIVTLPAHGTLAGTAPNLTYIPFNGFVGSDSFTFKASDGELESAPAVVSISVLSATTAQLINVDFGAVPTTTKTGFAATGQSTNDFWNYYTRDNGHGGWLTFGVLANLKFANGMISGAGLTVANAPGAWGTSSSDPMYADYLYPFSGNAVVNITNLGPGTFDVYVYSPDGNIQVNVGGVNYGSKSTANAPIVNPIVWSENQQYVVFRNVSVTNISQAVTVTVQPGLSGYATFSGLQIAGGATTTPPPATNTPPVAKATLVQPFALPGNTNLFVISADGSNAIVVLEASLSSDADNDPLTFEWLEDSLTPFATGVSATNTMSVGWHEITLKVSDGKSVSTASLQFEVITAPDGIVELAAAVERSGLDRNIKRQLNTVLLNNAANSMTANLQAFQNKVESYVSPSNLEWSVDSLKAAERLIQTLDNQ